MKLQRFNLLQQAFSSIIDREIEEKMKELEEAAKKQMEAQYEG